MPIYRLTITCACTLWCYPLEPHGGDRQMELDSNPQPLTDTSVGCDCASVGLSGQVSPFRQVRRFLVVFNVSTSFRTRGQWLCRACQPCVTTVINDLHTCVGPGKYHLSSPHLHARPRCLCVFPFTSFSFPSSTPSPNHIAPSRRLL